MTPVTPTKSTVRILFSALPALLVIACLGCGRREVPVQPSRTLDAQSPPEAAYPIRFDEATPAALLDFVYRSGKDAGLNTILEIVGGGVACVDFDLDGRCDLFFPGGGQIDGQSGIVSGVPSFVFRAVEQGNYDDVTEAAGMAVADLYTHGATAADFDHDGFVDLLVYGYRGVRLYCNQGDGTFRDVTAEAGLSEAPWTTAAAWADLSGNGMLDLYLGSYVQWDLKKHRTCRSRRGKDDVCSPNAFIGSEDAVFLADDEGRFTPSPNWGNNPRNGRALSVLAAVVEPSQPPAVYVANDLSANYLFRRMPDGTYAETGIASGVAVDASGTPNGSMGIVMLDFFGNQRFDLMVTNFEHEQIAIYRNDGGGLFRHASRETGLNALDAAVVGFGIVAADFSGDGREDVLLTSGHVQYDAQSGDIEQEPVLLKNVGGQTFQRQSPAGCDYFRRKSCGRGLAIADLDNDGAPDAVITHLFEPPVILRNVPSDPHSWLRIRLVGTHSPRTPIGTVVLAATDEHVMTRQLYSGGSYLSQSQQELFFRWPGDRSVDLTVQWSGGQRQHLSGVAPRQVLTVVEP